MLTLLNALYSRLTTDGTLTAAFPGGFHRDRAPEGTVMPYLVSKVVSSETHVSYGGSSRSNVQLRLSVFGVGHDAAGGLAATLIGALDGNFLTLSSGLNDTVRRKGDAVPNLLVHNAQGSDVWEWSVVYEYGVVSG